MTNTTITYLYRDASNYKAWSSVVLAGEFTFEALKPHLEEGEFSSTSGTCR